MDSVCAFLIFIAIVGGTSALEDITKELKEMNKILKEK